MDFQKRIICQFSRVRSPSACSVFYISAFLQAASITQQLPHSRLLHAQFSVFYLFLPYKKCSKLHLTPTLTPHTVTATQDAVHRTLFLLQILPFNFHENLVDQPMKRSLCRPYSQFLQKWHLRATLLPSTSSRVS